MTWHEYVDCDQELATSQTIEEDWERNLLASLNEEQTSDISDDHELDNTPILKVKTAANHLCELRDFAIAHKKATFIRIGHEEPEHSRRDHVGRDKNSQTN